jgi:CelD/BcsL family acetyltransferase involved in cellulose biosynthesis
MDHPLVRDAKAEILMPAHTMFDQVLAALAPSGHGHEAALEVDVLSGPSAAAVLLGAGAPGQGCRIGNVFHHAGLMRAALAADADRAAIVVAKRGGDITTIWPLRFEQRYGVKIATDLAAPLAQYSDVIGEPLEEEAFSLLRAKLRHEFGVDAILCRGVRKDSGLAEALAHNGIVDQSSAPFVDLKTYGTFQNYCARFSKQTARTRRQRRKKLEAKYGPLHFAVLNGKAGRDCVARALQWKRAWLDANALSSRVVGARDQQAILLEAAESSAAHVSTLSVRGEPVSVELGFSGGGNYVAYMGAFDPSFAAYSPGQEQMLLTIEWCFAQGFARYDLLPPRDAYKLHWTRQLDEEPVCDHCIPLSSAGALYTLARRYARGPIKRTVLSLPTELRVAARRYGPAAAGIGASAAAIGILVD